MFIIAGAGHPKTNKYVARQTRYCSHCRNDSFWVFEETRYYVSLFFIPVLPYKTEHLTYCGICGFTDVLNREEFAAKVRNEARPIN